MPKALIWLDKNIEYLAPLAILGGFLLRYYLLPLASLLLKMRGIDHERHRRRQHG